MAGNIKANFFWNMMGSLCNAASTLLLQSVVNRINGDTDAGTFVLAFSFAQTIATVGLFEIRPYQSTDLKRVFSFQDYFTSRILTCGLMMIIVAGYLGIQYFQGDSLEKILVVLFLCLGKVIDCMSDVFQGLFQQNDRLDLSGKALAFRIIAATVGFSVALMLTHQLMIASLFYFIFSVIWFAVYDLKVVFQFDRPGFRLQMDVQRKLFLECLPLFIGSFMSMYLSNAARFSVGNLIGEKAANIYSIIFMPASVINLFSIFLFRPVLTTLSVYWNEQSYKKYIRLTGILTLWVVLLTGIAALGAYLLGTPVLSWFYAQDVSAYRTELVISVVGGGIGAFSTLFYYFLTVMRKQSKVLLGYTVAFLSNFILVPFFIKNWNLIGAALSYPVLMLILSVCFLGIFFWYLQKAKKSQKSC